MLNICMERRRMREGGLPFSMTQFKTEKDDSEDEFFDCEVDEDQDGKIIRHAPWNKPEGRRSRIGNLTLIASDEPLFEPITQEPVPKTEDQLEDDAEVMLKLGPGSELCTQMMSASLLSDMESFKAANPNGQLEDFIRWYSPRDWIEEPDENGEVKGHLSQRMLIADNTWQTVWNTAKPVSARRQKRLFDDTKEAEKVLHYLETRNIGQICQLTLSALFHSALLRLTDEFSPIDFADNVKTLKSHLCKLSRENWTTVSSSGGHSNASTSSPKKWEALLLAVTNFEKLKIQANSLTMKFFENPKNLSESEKLIVSSMLNGASTELSGAAKNDISVRVLNMFAEEKISQSEFAVESETISSQSCLPDPIRKEYILRVGGKTVNKGFGGPQFMRTILDKHLRICGAFTENTTFF